MGATQSKLSSRRRDRDRDHSRTPISQVVSPGLSTAGGAYVSTVENNNSNSTGVSGTGNVVINNNPNGSSGGVVSLNYFSAPAPDPSDEIQSRISAALRNRYVPEAVYAAQLDGGCMPGTRVQILRDIENWIRNFASQKIFWLAGMAGMGKTAIGQTVCSHLREQTEIVLGGSFFCSRSTGSAGQRDVRCIIPTLARLLAQQSTKFSEALAAELKRDPEIPNHRVSEQVKRLLYKPLLALQDSHVSIIFVIDALDECGSQPNPDETTSNTESHRIVSEMLQALVDFSRSEITFPVKFLVTSRPETHIRDTPVSDTTFSNVLHLHTVNKKQVTADIRLYISTRLSSSPKLRNRFTDDDADMLARLCDGLFIVATTALNHILGGGFDASTSRFRTVLNSSRDGLSSGAAAPLDRMYSFILEEAASFGQEHADELQAMLRLLASLLSARTSLSVVTLADLVGVNKDDVCARLSRLHAVVHVPDDLKEPNLRTLHASFGDYLAGRASENIRISHSLGNDVLARGCLRVMVERLHFNVSQSGSSYEPNPATQPDPISPSLEYACIQWVYHIDGLSEPSALDAVIHAEFCPRLLFWLEVTSILGKVRRAAAMLLFAAGIVRSTALAQFLRDANSFVASSREAIEQSAPHIYLSALPFAPKNSLVYKTFSPLCTGLISVETFGIDQHGGRLIMTLTGHEKAVRSVVYSHDGRHIGSGSLDGTVRIWDTRTGEETISSLCSGDGAVYSVAFSPTGKSIVAGTEEGVLCIWSIINSHATQRRLSGHTGRVQSVSFSPNGEILASASTDKSVRLWEIETGSEVAILEGHTDEVIVVSFSSDGKILASGSADKTIRLWHVASREPAGQLLRVGDEVWGVSFSPDGRTLASGGQGMTARLWDLHTGTILSTLHGHSAEIRCIQFSPDGLSVGFASFDGTVRIWAVPQDTTDRSSIMLDGHTDLVFSASFSPDGLYIASASDDCTIRIWNAQSDPQAVQPLTPHHGNINSIAVSPCGSFIVSGWEDHSVRVWNMQTGELRFEPLIGHTKTVYSVTISSDGSLIASASSDCTIRLWDARTGEAIDDPLTGHEGDVMAVAFSSDTRWLASGSDDHTVRMWDVAKRKLSNIAPLCCTGLVLTVTFSPDSRLVAAGDRSGRIYLWHANTGQSVCELLHENNRGIRSIAFSADGARIVAGGGDQIRVWDINTRQRLLLLEGHNVLVFSVAVSSNGEFICSGSADETVRLWSATAGTPIAILRGHTDYVKSVTFAPDGQSVVSCSGDKTIRVWDVDAARLLSSSQASDPAAALASATLNDGWLVGPSGELLMWVPEKYRTYLQWSSRMTVIAQHRIAVTAGDDGWHRGMNWTSCWRRGMPSHDTGIM